VGCGQRWNKYKRLDESGFKAGVNGLTHANTLAAWLLDNKDIKLKVIRGREAICPGNMEGACAYVFTLQQMQNKIRDSKVHSRG